jgi:hypothetical protein
MMPVFVLDTTATDLEFPGALTGLEDIQYEIALRNIFFNISRWRQHAKYVMGVCFTQREMEMHIPRGSLMHQGGEGRRRSIAGASASAAAAAAAAVAGGMGSGMYWKPQIYANFDAAGLVISLTMAIQRRYPQLSPGLTQYVDHLRTTCRLSLREVAAPLTYFVAAHLLPLTCGSFTYAYMSIRSDILCTVESILAMESVISRLRLLIKFVNDAHELVCRCDQVMCTIDMVVPLLMSDCETTPTLLLEYINTSGVFRTTGTGTGNGGINIVGAPTNLLGSSSSSSSSSSNNTNATTQSLGSPHPPLAPPQPPPPPPSPSPSTGAHYEWLQPRQGISVPIAAKCFSNRYSSVHDIIMVRRIDNGVISIEDEDEGPTERDSWVEGYGWQIVHCRGCDKHVGWKFTRMRRRRRRRRRRRGW